MPLLQILEWAKANLLGLRMLQRTRNVEGSSSERIVAQSRLRMSDGGPFLQFAMRTFMSVIEGSADMKRYHPSDVIDLGCVETPAREERAELLSQLSYLDAVGQRFCFSN